MLIIIKLDIQSSQEFDPSLYSLSLSIYPPTHEHIVRSYFVTAENLFNIGGTIYRCPNPFLPPPFHFIVLFLLFKYLLPNFFVIIRFYSDINNIS